MYFPSMFYGMVERCVEIYILHSACCLIDFAHLFIFSIRHNHDKLKPVFIDVIKQSMPQANETGLALMRQELLKNCTGESIEVALGEAGAGIETVILKCSDIRASEPGGLPDIFASAMFDQIYYRQYNCPLIDCLRTLPQDQKFIMLISDFASKTLKTNTTYLLIISLILILFIILLSVPKYTLFAALGVDFIIAGLPYFAVKFAAPAFLPGLSEQQTAIAPLIRQFFNFISTYFMIALIAGILLLIAGIVIRISSGKKQSRKKKEEE
jgi:hypothetical protein